jgi:histone acetyltransferase (RNA polymerase elongator complex component)
MISRRPEDYTIEIGPMGPIGEGEALLLRINRNCPWNQCIFCPVYKGKRFAIREVDEVKRDIDAVRRVCDLLEIEVNLIEENGKETIEAFIKSHPEIYGEYPVNITDQHWYALQSLSHIVRWMIHGAERVFLQDANALLMKPRNLTEVLRYLKYSFPTVDTITCYARSKTCDQRSEEELKELKDAGLSWCFVGIESGDDQVLEFMKKGAKKKEHIEGGQKIMRAGINMAAFVMPGLAGKNREIAKKHIEETIEVLNEIRPSEVRVRSLAILEAAPLYQKWKSGEFEAPNGDQMVEELKRLIEGIHFDCTLETLQMTNVFTMKGQFSERKERLLQWIESYQASPKEDRGRFLLNRYLYNGYLACVKSWGMYDARLKATIEEAQTSLERHSPNALQKVERAIFEIKSKGIP